MDPGFYEMIERIEATQSGGSLAVLLSAARARFEAERLWYLECLVARRMAEVGGRQSDGVTAERGDGGAGAG